MNCLLSKNNNKLIALKKVIPFLNQIPDLIYFKLASEEFYLPGGKIKKLRDELESILDNYVMTYKRNVFYRDLPPEQHLCANLAGAKLNRKQLKILKIYEEKVKEDGVSFVVYKKPLKLIDPKTFQIKISG